VNELLGYITKKPAILGKNMTILTEQLDTGSSERLDILVVEEVNEGGC
jgi:hypothetical protein